MNPHYATFDTFSIGSNPLGEPFGPADERIGAPAAEMRTTSARPRVPVLARIAELESSAAAPPAISSRPTIAPPIERQRKIETPRHPEVRRDPAEPQLRATPVVQPASAPARPSRATAPIEQVNHWPLQVSLVLAAYARWIVLLAVLIAAGLTLLVIERGVELNDTNLQGPDRLSAYPSPAVATAAPIAGPTYELPQIEERSAPAASGPVKLARTAPRVQAALSPDLRLPPESAANQPQMAQRPDQPAASTTR